MVTWPWLNLNVENCPPSKWNKIKRILVPGSCAAVQMTQPKGRSSLSSLYVKRKHMITPWPDTRWRDIFSISRVLSFPWVAVSFVFPRISTFLSTSVSRNIGILGETKLFPKKPVFKCRMLNLWELAMSCSSKKLYLKCGCFLNTQLRAKNSKNFL